MRGEPEGVAHPVRVLAVLGDGDEEEQIDEATARMDDAYWARFSRGPFSWHRFTTWWIARRWVVPRDVRRR